jgi:outer membrane protein TolC
MRQAIIIIIIAAISFQSLWAQEGIEAIVNQIEKNNSSLSALHKRTEAEKLNHKTGIFLENPEAEFAHFWGKPDELGKRINLSVTQSFDFPTAYGLKNNISDLKIEQSELGYEQTLRALRTEARLLCCDLIYVNARLSQTEKRLEHAEELAAAFQKQFESGESNILDYNKAQLNLLNIRRERELFEAEKEQLLTELRSLNGGKSIDFESSTFDNPEIPADFEDWFSQSEKNIPSLQQTEKEIEINQEQIKLSKAESLPKFKVGYVSEALTHEQFRGVSFGVSLPLFENKNRVKHAKVQTEASRELITDKELRFYNYLKGLHAKALSLNETAQQYRSGLKHYNNDKLLKTAFEQGEISLIDYIQELSFFYDSQDKLLQTERELNKTIAKLRQYE